MKYLNLVKQAFSEHDCSVYFRKYLNGMLEIVIVVDDYYIDRFIDDIQGNEEEAVDYEFDFMLEALKNKIAYDKAQRRASFQRGNG
mgnify:CR=1 FL=1